MKIYWILARILMLVLELYQSLGLRAYALLGAIIATYVSMVMIERPSVEDLLLYANMCDGTDVMLNKESSLSLKVVVTVVVIIVVAIFIGVLNIFYFNAGITAMWSLITSSR